MIFFHCLVLQQYCVLTDSAESRILPMLVLRGRGVKVVAHFINSHEQIRLKESLLFISLFLGYLYCLVVVVLLFVWFVFFRLFRGRNSCRCAAWRWYNFYPLIDIVLIFFHILILCENWQRELLHFPLILMNRLNKTVFYFFIFSLF